MPALLRRLLVSQVRDVTFDIASTGDALAAVAEAAARCRRPSEPGGRCGGGGGGGGGGDNMRSSGGPDVVRRSGLSHVSFSGCEALSGPLLAKMLEAWNHSLASIDLSACCQIGDSGKVTAPP